MYQQELLRNETTEITYATWIQPLEIKSFNDKYVSIAFAKNFGIKKLMKNHKSIKKIEEQNIPFKISRNQFSHNSEYIT